MFIHKIWDFMLTYKIRKCMYCKKIRFCAYIDYQVIKDGKVEKGIKGNFCKDCQKFSHKDIFLKLKDKQYYIFHSISAK